MLSSGSPATKLSLRSLVLAGRLRTSNRCEREALAGRRWRSASRALYPRAADAAAARASDAAAGRESWKPMGTRAHVTARRRRTAEPEMQKIVAALALSGASALVAPAAPRATVKVQETKADLERLCAEATALPFEGIWDPLGCADGGWGLGNEATIGYLRHAEIKHGRIAMAGFLGFFVQSPGNFIGDIVSGDHAILPYRGYVAGCTPQRLVEHPHDRQAPDPHGGGHARVVRRGRRLPGVVHALHQGRPAGLLPAHQGQGPACSSRSCSTSTTRSASASASMSWRTTR